MSEQPQQEPQQNLDISGDTSLENVQIGGNAGRDLNVTQIQGKVVYVNIYDRFNAPDGLSGQPVRPIKPLTHNEYRQQKVLLNKVKKFWIEDFLKKSLHNHVLIELGLEEKPDAIQTPFLGLEEFPEQSGQNLSEGKDATEIFEQMGAGRTLLILGEPGSGKTITLLKLTQSLIARTETNLSQPIPVFFNLSSWGQKRQTIKEWLVEELRDKYQVSPRLGKAWVKEQQLLLLLDGLDEVRMEYRNACVGALNQFYQTHGQTEIVVCCRIKNYQALSQKLKLQGAICVQPLTSKQIEQYLVQAGSQMIALNRLLQQDAELRKFASSPLVLSVMSLAYAGCSPQALSHLLNSPEELYKQLFDAYIKRMFFRQSKNKKYPDEKSKLWLSFLARQMLRESKSIFLIESISLNWLPEKYVSAYILCIFIVFTLLASLDTVNFDANPFSPPVLFGIPATLIVGIMMATIFLVATFPVKYFGWSSKKAKTSASLVIIFVLFASLIHQTVDIFIFSSALGSFVILTYSSFYSEINTTAVPNQRIWESAKAAIIFCLLVFLGYLFFDIFYPSVPGLSLYWEYMSFFLPIIMIWAGYACIQHFFLRVIFFLNGKMPWNYARFLDYAAERIFLRKVGGGYIFIHRMLLEHFARMELEQRQD